MNHDSVFNFFAAMASIRCPWNAQDLAQDDHQARRQHRAARTDPKPRLFFSFFTFFSFLDENRSDQNPSFWNWKNGFQKKIRVWMRMALREISRATVHYLKVGKFKNQKINPNIFKSWMRILRKTPKSVLWLLPAYPGVVKNLKNSYFSYFLNKLNFYHLILNIFLINNLIFYISFL